MGKRLGALFLALPLSCAAMFGPRIEFASAGTQSYSDRATFSGAVYLGGDSIAAESQQLTLHVGEIPADAGDEYDDSYMTSELTFYNAGEEDATLRLAYPCPAMPKDVSAREYRLSLDGEAIEPQVCHSYAGYFNRTINVEDVLDGAAMRSPDFYRADLPATEYKFRTDLSQVTLTDAEKKHLALVLTFDCDQSATRIISCNVMNFEVINGRLRLAFDLKGGEEIVGVTVAGKDIANLSYGVYTDLARTEAVATHIYCGRSETTFGSFAASFYPEGCEVSRADWARGLARPRADAGQHYGGELRGLRAAVQPAPGGLFEVVCLFRHRSRGGARGAYRVRASVSRNVERTLPIRYPALAARMLVFAQLPRVLGDALLPRLQQPELRESGGGIYVFAGPPAPRRTQFHARALGGYVADRKLLRPHFAQPQACIRPLGRPRRRCGHRRGGRDHRCGQKEKTPLNFYGKRLQK